MVVKWNDKKEMTKLHDDIMKDTGKINHKTKTPIIKHHCVLEYKYPIIIHPERKIYYRQTTGERGLGKTQNR